MSKPRSKPNPGTKTKTKLADTFLHNSYTQTPHTRTSNSNRSRYFRCRHHEVQPAEQYSVHLRLRREHEDGRWHPVSGEPGGRPQGHGKSGLDRKVNA